MKNRGIIFMTIALLASFFSCKEDAFDYGLGNFRLDLATVETTGSNRFYRLDNQTILHPTTEVPAKFSTGNRILLNYKIISETSNQEFSIEPNAVSTVNSGSIKALTSNLADDPLHLESIWQSGDWVNFRLGFEYNSTQHGIAMFYYQKTGNDTIYLDLRHSKNGDTPGYLVRTYASYPLKPFSKTTKSTPLKVRVNTSDEGVRHFVFNYISPTQD